MSADDPTRHVVARAVLPVRDAGQVMALYLDGQLESAGFAILDRHSIRLDAGRAVSFGSYFNAFPASYWSAHTHVREVRLTVRVAGVGSIQVMRSDAEARSVVVEERRILAAEELTFDLPLVGFDEGGCYWFDLVAGADGLIMAGAEWTVAGERPGGTASVGMATFNRPADCLAQLTALAGDEDVLAVLDRIIVVDQGTDRVTQQTGFDDVAHRLGERLVLVRQANLGGSGGFSRAMAETLDRGESDYVLLLDDDAICEPEAIVRAVRFADHASAPTIVGGGMIHIDARTVLYAQSEQWDTRIGWVDLGRTGAYDHDYARTPFRSTPFAHRLQRSDFNGWWMCLIPVSVLDAHGLSLPLFLKGDDVEFGLRAKEHGVKTVSVPGIALWHLGWGGKAPTRTWEAYFLHRNRLIGELIHSPRRRPHLVIAHSLLGDLKPLLTLQYSAVSLRAHAIEDVFDGPQALPIRLANRAGEIRALWATFADAKPIDPTAIGVGPGRARAIPRGRAAQASMLVRLWLRHLLVPVSSASRSRPDAHVRADELSWATFARIDSALVDTPDGAATVWYQRDRGDSLRALGRSIRLHARLWWAWPTLARRFRRAAPELASPRAWAEIFRDQA